MHYVSKTLKYKSRYCFINSPKEIIIIPRTYNATHLKSGGAPSMNWNPSLTAFSSRSKVTPSIKSNSGSASNLWIFDMAPTAKQYPRDPCELDKRHCLNRSSVEDVFNIARTAMTTANEKTNATRWDISTNKLLGFYWNVLYRLDVLSEWICTLKESDFSYN